MKLELRRVVAWVQGEVSRKGLRRKWAVRCGPTCSEERRRRHACVPVDTHWESLGCRGGCEGDCFHEWDRDRGSHPGGAGDRFRGSKPERRACWQTDFPIQWQCQVVTGGRAECQGEKTDNQQGAEQDGGG